jgi:hypothetical protein
VQCLNFYLQYSVWIEENSVRRDMSQCINIPITNYDKYYYKMKYETRGVALIIDNQIFNDPYLQRRKNERNNLAKLLCKLGFKVSVRSNNTCEEIEDLMIETAKADNSNAACLFVAVLTRCKLTIDGNIKELYAFDDTYSPGVIWDNLTGDKCKSFVGKPKLIFVQATSVNTQTDGQQSIQVTIPLHADYLFLFSKISPNYSGATTMETFLELLSISKGSINILSLLTKLIQKDKNEHHPPNIVSMLTKLLVLDLE